MIVAVDANALDRKTPDRGALVDRFEALLAAGRFALMRGAGIEAELGHPATPATSRGMAATVPAPPARPLSAAQHIARIRVRAIVQGNARPGRHTRDAAHVSEAAEAGCRYFITYDGRLLARRLDLEGFALPSGLRIVTLDEFLDAIAAEDRDASGDRDAAG